MFLIHFLFHGSTVAFSSFMRSNSIMLLSAKCGRLVRWQRRALAALSPSLWRKWLPIEMKKKKQLSWKVTTGILANSQYMDMRGVCVLCVCHDPCKYPNRMRLVSAWCTRSRVGSILAVWNVHEYLCSGEHIVARKITSNYSCALCDTHCLYGCRTQTHNQRQSDMCLNF